MQTLLPKLISLVALAVAPLAWGKDIPLNKVPGKVMAAAKAAVPGIAITEAEAESTADGLVYELDGKSNGKEYVLHVSAAGKVLKVEEDKEDQSKDDDKEDSEDDDKDDENDVS